MYDHLALSDNGFLFDTRTGNTFSLSRSGTFVLRALIAGADPDDLVSRVTAHFDVEPAVAERDVDQFLFRLRDMGLTAEDTAAGDGDSDGAEVGR